MSRRAKVTLYSTTFAATLKIRSDISKIKHILNSKKIEYEDVDLSQHTYRRSDMLRDSDDNPTLPQLHVNNRFIGTVDEIQEYEDWGELDAILTGVSPTKLAADAAAKAQAEAAAFAAAASAAARHAAVTPYAGFSSPTRLTPRLSSYSERSQPAPAGPPSPTVDTPVEGSVRSTPEQAILERDPDEDEDQDYEHDEYDQADHYDQEYDAEQYEEEREGEPHCITPQEVDSVPCSIEVEVEEREYHQDDQQQQSCYPPQAEELDSLPCNIEVDEAEQEPEPIVEDQEDLEEEEERIVVDHIHPEEDHCLESPKDLHLKLGFDACQEESSEEEVPTPTEVKSHPLQGIDSGHLLASPGKPFF